MNNKACQINGEFCFFSQPPYITLSLTYSIKLLPWTKQMENVCYRWKIITHKEVSSENGLKETKPTPPPPSSITFQFY